MIRFVVPAVPVPMPRPRAVRRGKHAQIVSNPSGHPITAFKATVRLAASQAYQGPPLKGPLFVMIDFVLPRPEAKRWKRKSMPRYPGGNGDVDNHAKGVLDALQKLLYENDSCITTLHVSKSVAAGDEQPHVVVQVTELESE